jgi:3-oxoacyl-ACP reductase-like protein
MIPVSCLSITAEACKGGAELMILASPKGGQPPLDPKSDLAESQTPAMSRFKQDLTAQKALSQTVKLADHKSEDYDTVFYVGGHLENERLFMSGKKTAIITGASGGIGAGLIEGFLREGYNVVGTSREASRELTTSGSLVLVNGDIGKQQTAAYAVEAAINHFGAVDILVNNAGIFLTKPFTDFTTEDFDALVST